MIPLEGGPAAFCLQIFAANCRRAGEVEHGQRGRVARLDPAESQVARLERRHVRVHELARVGAADGSHLLGRKTLLGDEPRHERAVRVEMRLPGGTFRPVGLFVSGVRGVIGRQVVERSVAERFEQGLPIGAAAERRVHLHPAAVLIGDLRGVEKEMVRRDFTRHFEAPLSRLTDQGQTFADRVMAQFASQVVLLDHLQRKPRGRNLAGRRTPPLVSRFATMGRQQDRVFAVKADVTAAIVRQRFIELAECRKEQVADARAHINLVRHGERQGRVPGPIPAYKVTAIGTSRLSRCRRFAWYDASSIGADGLFGMSATWTTPPCTAAAAAVRKSSL